MHNTLTSIEVLAPILDCFQKVKAGFEEETTEQTKRKGITSNLHIIDINMLLFMILKHPVTKYQSNFSPVSTNLK